MEVERTPFSDRAFGILDEDGSGELDFHEFIAGLWLIASANNHHLCRFGFDIFDEDGGGSLDEAELDAMFRMMHNVEVLSEKVEAAYRHIIDEAKKKRDGMLSIEDESMSGKLEEDKKEVKVNEGKVEKEEEQVDNTRLSTESNEMTEEKLADLESAREEKERKKKEKERRKKDKKERKKMQRDLLEIERMIVEEVDEDEKRRRKRRKKKSGNAKNAFGSIGITIPNSDEEDDHDGEMEEDAEGKYDDDNNNNNNKKRLLNNGGKSFGSKYNDGDFSDEDEEEDIEVTLEEMYKYVDEFPELLEPIIELQKQIRKKCLGISYWKKAMKRRVKMFGNENMDKILFEKKRLAAKKEKMLKEKRERKKMQRLKEIEEERKIKEEEEFQRRVEYKLAHCTQNEKNYREACKAVERARLTLKEAEDLGRKEGIDNVAQCARLRQRLQRAKGEEDAMWRELEKEWDEQKAKELEKKRKNAEEQAIAELMGPGGPKMVKADAKKMRWVFRLMPRVDDSLKPLGEITYKECKEKVKKEYILDAILEAEKAVEKKYSDMRIEEKKFVQDVILENPWEEAQDPNAKKEEEVDFLTLAPTEPFMNEDDWVLHLSVEGTYFQSADIVMFQKIVKEVPKRILRMAGITPILKYKRLTAEEKRQLKEKEKQEKLKALAAKNSIQLDFQI